MANTICQTANVKSSGIIEERIKSLNSKIAEVNTLIDAQYDILFSNGECKDFPQVCYSYTVDEQLLSLIDNLDEAVRKLRINNDILKENFGDIKLV